MNRGEWEQLPVQIRKSLVQTAAYTRSGGKTVLYTVVAEGACATFFGAELEPGRTVVSLDIPGASGSWTVVEASDGRIYFGTYENAGLYRFDPQKSDEGVEDLGTPVPGSRFIYSLVPDENGCVYGGTWPNCAIFKYDGMKNRVEKHYEHIAGEELYVRFLCRSPHRNKLYAGIMSHARIIEFDFEQGVGRNILPERFFDQSHVALAGIASDRLLALSMHEHKALVFDLESGQLILERRIDFDSPAGADPGCTDPESTVFYGVQNRLVGVDVESEAVTIVPFRSGAVVRDPTEIGDGVVAGLCFEGEAFTYDTATRALAFHTIDFPKKPVEIRQFHISGGRTLFASGYLRGGTAIYDIDTGGWAQHDGIGQCEGITSHRGKVYFGKYPGAWVYEYDPSAPWDRAGEDTGNPNPLFELGSEYRQDRPFAMHAYGDRLFVGTIPDYGRTEGCLASYDLLNGELQVRFDVTNNRSVVSLASDGNVLYGGTTIYGGLGSVPVEESGTLFAVDIETGALLFDRVPVAGAKNVGALLVLDESHIAGCADSTLFVYCTETGEVDVIREIAPHDTSRDYRWQISFLDRAPSGAVYGVSGRRLFAFDPDGRNVEVISEEPTHLLGIDSVGRVYTLLEAEVRTIVRSRVIGPDSAQASQTSETRE